MNSNTSVSWSGRQAFILATISGAGGLGTIMSEPAIPVGSITETDVRGLRDAYGSCGVLEPE